MAQQDSKQREFYVTLPIRAQEYGTMEAGTFPGNVPEITAHRWGALHCTDAAGVHWTALGDYDFSLALRAAGTPAEPIEGYDHGEGWNRQSVKGSTMSEFPMEEFRPQYAVHGWPDEWHALAKEHGALTICTWEEE